MTNKFTTNVVEGSTTSAVTHVSGYQLHHIPRSTRQWGGGVGLLSRSTVKAVMLHALDVQSFESLQMRLTHHEWTMTLIVLYRPPPSSVNCLKTSMFFDDFYSLLESHITTPGDVIIIGDFNIYYEATNDSLTIRFNQILSAYNMIQHVKDPMHVHGHMLDLCVTRSDSHLIDTNVGDLVSDHHVIECKVDIARLHCPR